MFVSQKFVARLMDEHERERESWRKERSELLTRIQSPEQAPVLSAPEPSGQVLHLPLDDDGAFEDYIERQQLSGSAQ